MVGQKVGDPGGRELDRGVNRCKLPQQFTGDLRHYFFLGRLIGV